MHMHYMCAQTHKVTYHHRDLCVQPVHDWEVLKPLGDGVWREGVGDACPLIVDPSASSSILLLPYCCEVSCYRPRCSLYNDVLPHHWSKDNAIDNCIMELLEL